MTIRITITGPQAGGKTRFLNEVLLPALRKYKTYGYYVNDAGVQELGGPSSGQRVDVLVTNDLALAKKHLVEP